MTSGVKAHASAPMSHMADTRRDSDTQRRCQYKESCLSHGTIDSSILGSLIRLGRCEYRDYCQLRTTRSSHLVRLVRPYFFFQEGSASRQRINSRLVTRLFLLYPAWWILLTVYFLFTCLKCLRVRQQWVLSGGWSKRSKRSKRVQLWLKVERSQNLLTVRSRGVS